MRRIDVLELAHIARPGQARMRSRRLGLEAAEGPAFLGREAREEGDRRAAGRPRGRSRSGGRWIGRTCSR